jgi:hypothetical protein
MGTVSLMSFFFMSRVCGLWEIAGLTGHRVGNNGGVGGSIDVGCLRYTFIGGE